MHGCNIYSIFESAQILQLLLKGKVAILMQYVLSQTQREHDLFSTVAGIPPEKLVEAHGTFATATCTLCERKYNGDEIKVRSWLCDTFWLSY